MKNKISNIYIDYGMVKVIKGQRNQLLKKSKYIKKDRKLIIKNGVFKII